MPRRQQGPRIWLERREGREAVWTILDDRKKRSTGCGADDREGAERALERYIAEKHRAPASARAPGELMIADVLNIYGTEHGPQVAAPETLAYCLQALLPFWGDRPVSAIRGETCRAYLRSRGVSDGTVRRELGALRAALRHCSREGYLVGEPLVWMPPTSAPRDRWLTRGEAARLLQAARPWPHLQRFIMIGLYSCSRSGVIRALQWQPNTDGGHIDIERGVIYRKSVMQRETAKRATPVRIHRRLLPHLQQWRKTTRQYVIEYNGRPMLKTPQNSWRQARDAAGLDKAVIPHILRHTGGTWMAQRGVPRGEICSFMGITDAEFERTYLHHSPEFHAQAAEF